MIGGDDILHLVFNHYMNIPYITIERDKESCEIMDKSYRIYSLDGVPINHYPTKEFVFADKVPILSAVNTNVFRLKPYRMNLKEIINTTNNINNFIKWFDKMNKIENEFVRLQKKG